MEYDEDDYCGFSVDHDPPAPEFIDGVSINGLPPLWRGDHRGRADGRPVVTADMGADGDHSCPCPLSDSECLEHTLKPIVSDALDVSDLHPAVPVDMPQRIADALAPLIAARVEALSNLATALDPEGAAVRCLHCGDA